MRPIGPFQITYNQRKLAGYFSRHRRETWISETVSELPFGTQLAIKKFFLLAEEPKEWTVDGRPVQGPILKEQDYKVYADELLSKCLQSTQFCYGRPERVEYTSSSRYFFEALKDKSTTLMTEKKIRKYNPALLIRSENFTRWTLQEGQWRPLTSYPESEQINNSQTPCEEKDLSLLAIEEEFTESTLLANGSLETFGSPKTFLS